MESPTGTLEEQERERHQLTLSFLATLDGGLRQAQMYETDNRLVIEIRERLESQLRELWSSGSTFSFFARDDNPFVNGRRLRCDGPTYLRLQDLMRLLSEREIGGIEFFTPLDSAEWSLLLRTIARIDRRQGGSLREAGEQTLREGGLAGKVELLPSEARAPAARGAPAQRRSFAVRACDRAIRLVRLYLENLEHEEKRRYFHLRLQRAMQDLVTVCMEDGWKHLGLTRRRRPENYLPVHSVNVAILSLVLGRKLGFSRARLTELGMAAVLHDLGKAFLPPELMNKPGGFDDAELRLLADHPALGAEALLRTGQYGEALLKRLRVICEHHQSLGDGANYHPYSRIIAVSEVFDALTSARPHRGAYLPDDAIRMLLTTAGKRLDRDIVHFFVQTVGLYPCGTLLELSTKERVIALEPHPDPEKWGTPFALLIRDAEGKVVVDPPTLDLSDRTAGRSIVRTLDPVAEKISILEELSPTQRTMVR